MKKSKLLVIFATIALALSCFNFFSCKKVSEPTIYYNVKEEIALYDTVEINLLDGVLPSEVKVVSSNEKVLKVKGLSIFASSTGKAKLTVVYGKKKQVQNISVYKSKGELSIGKSDMPLLLGQTYLPNNQLLFNGKIIDEVVFSYSSNNDNVKVLNGKLYANNFGDSIITVNATINGKIVASDTFNCVVNSTNALYLNQNKYEIFITNAVRGVPFNTTANLSTKLLYDGQIYQNAQSTYLIEDENVAKINNGVIEAVSVGKTYITATYNKDGTVYKTERIPVVVNIPVLQTEDDVIIDRQNEYQTFDGETIFGENFSVGRIEDLTNYSNYELENNKIKTANMSAGEHICILYDENNKIGVKVNVVVADYVVYNKDDLAELKTFSKGYIALANDIYYNEKEAYSSAGGQTFSGVFNGLGHKIYNMTISGCGLFYQLDGGRVENLSVINATINGAASGVICYRVTSGESVIDNVYISVKRTNTVWSVGGVFAFGFTGKMTVSNCYVKIEGDNLFSGGNGKVTARCYQTLVIFDNAFIVGTGTLCGTDITGSNGIYNKFYANVNKSANTNYLDEDEFISAKTRGKISFENFNKYWNLEQDIPSFK